MLRGIIATTLVLVLPYCSVSNSSCAPADVSCSPFTASALYWRNDYNATGDLNGI